MRRSIFSRGPKRRADDDDDLNMSIARRIKVDVIGNLTEVNVSLLHTDTVNELIKEASISFMSEVMRRKGQVIFNEFHYYLFTDLYYFYLCNTC